MSDWKPTPGRDALTRDGQRATEIKRRHTDSPYVIIGRVGDTYYTWTEDGRSSVLKSHHPIDLVADAEPKPDADPLPAPGPVRERTVREIVPGVYGRLRIEGYDTDEGLAVRLVDRNGDGSHGVTHYLTADEVNKVISTLTAIRDAMEDKP